MHNFVFHSIKHHSCVIHGLIESSCLSPSSWDIWVNINLAHCSIKGTVTVTLCVCVMCLLQVKKTYCHGTYRAGAMRQISLVGAVDEEVGDYFSEFLGMLEESPFLKVSVHWPGEWQYCWTAKEWTQHQNTNVFTILKWQACPLFAHSPLTPQILLYVVWRSNVVCWISKDAHSLALPICWQLWLRFCTLWSQLGARDSFCWESRFWNK